MNVSVIVPVYNVQKYLRQCLESLIAQTMSDFEVLCVDDGSTDDSSAILSEYAQKDSRFHIITQKNAGQSAARNHAVEKAQGKYLFFLDSDDWIEPDALEFCFKNAEKQNSDILIFEFHTHYEQPEMKNIFTDFSPSHQHDGILNGKDLLIQLWNNHNYIAAVWKHFLRRDFYIKAGLHFREGIIYEDELFCLECNLSAEKAQYFHKQLYNYRIRTGSTVTQKFTARNLISMGTVYLEAAKFLKNHPEYALLPEIRRIQDGWLYKSNKIMSELSAEEIRLAAEAPYMIAFLEILHYYSESQKKSAALEIAEERREAILQSGSYRIGQKISAVLKIFMGKTKS